MAHDMGKTVDVSNAGYAKSRALRCTLFSSFLLTCLITSCAAPLQTQVQNSPMEVVGPEHRSDRDSLVQQLDTMRGLYEQALIDLNKMKLENDTLRSAMARLEKNRSTRISSTKYSTSAASSSKKSESEKDDTDSQTPDEPSALTHASRSPDASADPSPKHAENADESKSEKILIQKLYDQARAAFEEKQYDSAIMQFSQFAKRYSSTELTDNAYYWLGKCYLAKDEPLLALDEFSRLITDFPNGNKVPDAQFEIARIYEILGWYEKAVSAYRRFSIKFKNHPLSQEAMVRHERLVSALQHQSHPSDRGENTR